MNTKTVPHLEFAPPAQAGTGRAWVVAGIVHVLLFLALGLATAWKTQPQTVQAEAELWSATPQAAAPRLQEPPPEPQPEPVPEPTPAPPAKPTPPPPPAPDPALELRDAQIALEKKKQQEKKKEADKVEKLKAEKLKVEKEKAEKEKAEKTKAENKRKELDKEKLAKEKKAQEEKDRDKKKAIEKAKAEKAEKADAARADALRQENLQRMQGMAGASGGESASGNALKSSGPSASYGGRLVARIKPNITYTGDAAGNARAEVEVKVSPDGTIMSRRIVQSSGNKAWDEAVLRAIDKTEVLPKDSDGRVPPVIVLGFRPLD